jgi:hypothetical protein
MKKILVAAAVMAVTAVAAASPTNALVTFDPSTGTGWVGKGDVQLAYGWNNAKGVSFSYEAGSTTTWTCTREWETPQGKEMEVVQNRHNATSTTGLLVTVTRENSKGKDGPVTGFRLDGWNGAPTVVTSGQDLGTCPAEPSGFVFDVGSDVTASTGGGLIVTFGGVSHTLQ